MSQILKLHAPRDLRYEAHTLPLLGPHGVHLRSRLGAISTGTESAWYFGTDPQLDPNFRPIRFDRPTFPKFLGYEKVAEVVAVGAEVEGLNVGQRVVTNYGHAEEMIWPAARVAPIPDDVTDEEAVLTTLMNVASHGVRRSRLQLGEDVLIMGQGVVGLLNLIAARLAGANRVIVADLYEKRLALAKQFGADVMLNPHDGSVAEAIVGRFGPAPLDVAFECSSSYEALAEAMMVVRRNGRLCVVAQLKGAYPQHPTLGMDFHLGELELISSDGSWDWQKHARWFFSAIQRGAIQNLGDMISHRVPFSEIDRGFQMLEQQPEEVVKVVVEY
ncbi:MAG: zinc-binding alcohol dehydrogenase [Chloroflexota bacterium]